MRIANADAAADLLAEGTPVHLEARTAVFMMVMHTQFAILVDTAVHIWARLLSRASPVTCGGSSMQLPLQTLSTPGLLLADAIVRAIRAAHFPLCVCARRPGLADPIAHVGLNACHPLSVRACRERAA